MPSRRAARDWLPLERSSARVMKLFSNSLIGFVEHECRDPPSGRRVLRVDLSRSHAPPERSRALDVHEVRDSSRPVNSRYASRYLARVAVHYLRRQLRTGWLLVPADLFQIVPHILLIERRLRATRRIALGRPETRRVGRQTLRQSRSIGYRSRPNSNFVSARMMPRGSAKSAARR